MTCTGGPLNARWAADWRPFPPLPSWQCTATRPELWLASTLLRFPVCGDSLLCDVRPVWRPGHATSGAEAAMPRGPLQIDSGAEPTKCHVIPFTSAHVACQFCPSLLTSTRASTAPKNHHGLDIGEPVVHFSHWTAHAGIAHLTFHPCYQALSSCCCCVGASRWGTPPAAAVSAVCRSCPAPPVVPTQTQTKPRTDSKPVNPASLRIDPGPPSSQNHQLGPSPNHQPPPWICSIQDIAMAENKMQLEDCAFGPRLSVSQAG